MPRYCRAVASAGLEVKAKAPKSRTPQVDEATGTKSFSGHIAPTGIWGGMASLLLTIWDPYGSC